MPLFDSHPSFSAKPRQRRVLRPAVSCRAKGCVSQRQTIFHPPPFCHRPSTASAIRNPSLSNVPISEPPSHMCATCVSCLDWTLRSCLPARPRQNFVTLAMPGPGRQRDEAYSTCQRNATHHRRLGSQIRWEIDTVGATRRSDDGLGTGLIPGSAVGTRRRKVG